MISVVLDVEVSCRVVADVDVCMLIVHKVAAPALACFMEMQRL
jgi:hypothetical protein